MLAISGLPAGGDQFGTPIVLSADSADATNILTIVLDDISTAGYVTATITAESSGVPPTTTTVYNFGDSITFTGTTDADGSVVNKVVFTTPYETSLQGLGAGSALSQTNWNVIGRFAASPIPLSAVQTTLFNADTLSAQAGNLGGTGPSTIAGEFQSPTDLSIPGSTGADIALTSGVGIADEINTGITTYALSLASTNGTIAIDADIATRADLTISSSSGSLALGGGTRSIASSSGDITITNTSGPVTLTNTSVVATLGSIVVATPSDLTVAGGNASFTAPAVFDPGTNAGLVSLTGLLGLSLPSALAITAGRLELMSNAPAPILLTNLAVSSLAATVGGDLSITDSVPLVISDFNPTVPSTQITARNVTLIDTAGLRIVDGIAASGTLKLSTWDGSTTPTVPVQFAATSVGDNPLAAAPFAGTLRDMIEYVNANQLVTGVTTQPMSILFDEGGAPVATGGTITLQATLPGIVKPITFDGTLPSATLSHPADLGGIVGIDGAGVASNGLTLTTGSSGSTIRDAAFHGFTAAGMRVETQKNLMSGLNLGADRTGAAAPNGIGVDLVGTSAIQNTVGIATLGVDAGNLIVSNTIAGVFVRTGANYNTIAGNTIGGVGSGNLDGIAVQSSIGTVIGGTQAALGNTISNNARNGVRLTSVNGVSPAYGSLLTGNDIADNPSAGVMIEGGGRNVIGGTALGAGNTIARNGIGVQMVSKGIVATRGNLVIDNAITDSVTGGVLIDQGYANLLQGNVISDSAEGSSEWGIRIFRSSTSRSQGPNQVFQNLVSGSGNPTAADPGLTGGIVVENASGQVIGGRGTLANQVFDNRGSGIVIIGGTGVNGAIGNLVEGNYVGSDKTGAYLGNAYDGIRIQGGLANVIRANTVRFSDIAENQGVGISVHDAMTASPTLGNLIVSNSVSDNDTGILVQGSSGTVVGGTLPALGNWVFDSTGSGIVVRDSAATGAATGTVLRNNRVGLATRTTPAGNGGYGIDLQSTVGTVVDFSNLVANNQSGGIRVQGGRNVAIGSTAGVGNTIRNNAGNGIEITEPAAPGRTEAVLVAANVLRGNSGNGIAVTTASGRVTGITIGRDPPVNRPDASTNTIVGNALAGVLVDGAQSVSIVGNAIASNGGLGIQLINGANGGVSNPSLSAATPRVIGQRSPQIDVAGSVTRTGVGIESQTYVVDIYGTNTATSQQFSLGRVIVTIRAGAASANFRVIVGVPGQRFNQIAATATLGTNTSEFSGPMSV